MCFFLPPPFHMWHVLFLTFSFPHTTEPRIRPQPSKDLQWAEAASL